MVHRWLDMSVPLVTMSFPGEHEGHLEKLTVAE